MDKSIVSKIYSGPEFRYRRKVVLKMSAEELASKLGVHPHSINRYENGNRMPTAYEVVLMAHHLGIPFLDITEKVSDDSLAFLVLLNLERLRYAKDGEEPICTWPDLAEAKR
ncbi:helix-turn-helix transcriptional regulator [Streptomyces sp. ISL-100]|uniref:helix-turn-helix domain-containing protein n=1 Tax=Streptomyces sp. ISL-100 TaxID=2819173 RepID=UPI001BE6B177|nr:helix-turn-helix transcriptional regulator [Streptomyces sp. ISL-100]MBT2400474.1 helix-turn-helix transcriptional regulator [Streptomyces sp. ISL-100]